MRGLLLHIQSLLKKVAATSLQGRAGRGSSILLGLLCAVVAQGQIVIGGNVYGGGNKGKVGGNTTVTVKAVSEVNSVFGGARQADIGGRAYTNIDGENATGDIRISSVYGGNDVAGTIGTSTVPVKTEDYPSGLTEVIPEPTEAQLTESGKTREVWRADYKKAHPEKNDIDNTWNAFVRTSRSVKSGTTDEDKWIIIGTLFGGGNGDFTYTEADGVTPLQDAETEEYLVKEGEDIIARSAKPFVKPDLGKTYLEIKAGEIAHVYGGGNYATVTGNTTICINNESDICQTYVDALAAANHISSDELFKAMSEEFGINTFQTNLTNLAMNHARVFGGNNKADMAIQPTWNLQKGIIRDLYSGGNEGRMTSSTGLLLEIDPKPDSDGKTDKLSITNVYGGCRRADVRPLDSKGEEVTVGNPEGYNFPTGLSARTLVRGGHINNIYGGNDISGRVYGGSAVGIYTTVYGDVYGGGNGSYAYTDNPTLGAMDIYKDFYYNPIDILGLSGSSFTQAQSVEALNKFRPNAEQVSVRLKGKGTRNDMTIIHGGVYCGGNSASMDAKLSKPLMEIKFGSYVAADNVYLGNNGVNMKDEKILELYAKYVDNKGNVEDSGTDDNDYSTLDLTDATTFADYMDGVVMHDLPDIVFDGDAQSDKDTYIENSSYVGSFYCGGNVGSMAISGFNSYSISHGLNIYNKFVGGCFNADIKAGDYNAAYQGGILGAKDERGSNSNDFYTHNGLETGNIKDRLEINLEKLTITPLRWNEDETQLIWNTNKWDNDEGDFVHVDNSAVDDDTRLLGGNVYGGCYSSGHVNGNIIININEDVLNKNQTFGEKVNPSDRYPSGVKLEKQRVDEMAVALSVFGAGYGKETEIWGSTTVNLNKGYVFQVFGGGEKGVVGKKNVDGSGVPVLDEDDNYVYEYDSRYSSTVNLKGQNAGYEGASGLPLADTEFIYGGGSEGNVCGNTYVNLGNGRVYDVFGGASDADILGHSEVYIGRQPNGSGGYQDGFPWVSDIVYGGNDFGGTIHSKGNFKDRVRVETGSGAFDVLGKVYNPGNKETPDVVWANAYVEYLQGRVDSIVGGSYGNYNYALEKYLDDNNNSPKLPSVESTFVNIRPNTEYKADNKILGIFGGGTGYPGNRDGDRSQDRSYVLIDIPDDLSNFRSTEIFGAGSYNGLGMKYSFAETTAVDGEGNPTFNLDNASAIIDLVRGKVGAAYGGSYMEGVTRRTMVNVPQGSTINIGSIFGGAYGQELLAPCDVYEAHVNYSSTDATLIYNSQNELMKGAIYGGNNTCRRTLYGFIDINSPVWMQHPEYGKTRANIYGAGCGPMTWSEYTEVNLNNGAEVYEVYGGAQNGEVLNAESAKSFMNRYYNPESTEYPLPAFLQTIYDEKGYSPTDWRSKVWPYAWTLGEGYYYPYNQGGSFIGDFNSYATNTATNLSNPLARTEEMDDRQTKTYKYNTNVRIHDGAWVANYAYGGGLGTEAQPGTGDVYGTTYIALLGGEVSKDIYAAGTVGVVYDNYESGEFVASSNAYIKGGMVRNVYGGGWEGSVGKHTGTLSAPYYDFTNNKPLDIPGETHVVIGDLGDDKTFANGNPAITRNVYGGGEGGSIWGTTHLTINNGMIGYRWKNTGSTDSPIYKYVEELDDKAANDGELDGSGNAFGGGYILNSYVDKTDIKMFGGQIRGSLYGGGEVGPVGRGTMLNPTSYSTGILNGKARVFKAGKTHVEMYNGHVLRNVFGGGRGKDSWEGDGTYYMDPAVVATLDHGSKGFVFGQTEVNIYGGEVGSVEGMTRNFGNVFGGGDEGTVVSAYEKSDHTLGYGEKIGVRYGEDAHDGYYFKKENGVFLTETVAGETHNVFTEDCKVLVEPWLQVTKAGGIDFDSDGEGSEPSKNYPQGSYIPTAYLNTLGSKTGDTWPSGWDDVDVGTPPTKNDQGVITPEIERGIIIHNAVFAGGNIALGSNSMNANEITVYGNATASVHDVYNRDFITIGTGHTGGLYGDGNLTLVDGYRELNITNYGTDKYHLAPSLTIAQYEILPEREKAYYEPKYECIKVCTDNEGTTYSDKSTLPYDELTVLFLDANGESLKDGETAILEWNDTKKEWVPNPTYWIAKGVVSTYAGRIMNTIQRADFCGVFGSRMVMKGARDRVPDKEDSKNYTINRVREVSLNKMEKADETAAEDKLHGNYFGIYSNVNYFGSLTSDVEFHTAKRTTSADLTKYPDLTPNNETFAQWKADHKTERSRNNGNCHNQLALASGVFLELTSEKSKGDKINEKDWGLITGVVELDLINVQTGVGGGYVYAKNEHGKRKAGAGHQNTTLTALNKTAASKWNYGYETDDDKKEEWETSGNFIHSSQTIIDDCYNESARYKGTGAVPAHYWFISGSVYVYDQYITAHTGSPNAYSETVELPITIYAASNGKMTLMDVQPNLYAYYSSYTNATTNTQLSGEAKVVINNQEYHLNDPISYWDWYKLPAAERRLFVEDTYVIKEDCKIGSTSYTAGTVLRKDQYDAMAPLDTDGNRTYPSTTHVREENGVEQDVAVPFTEVVRSSNNLSHNTGYILTYSVTNPEKWKPWYTELSGNSLTNKITTAEYDVLDKESTKDSEGRITKKGQDAYYDGPTYTPTTTSLYGQREYDVMDIIPEEVYTTYTNIDNQYIPTSADKKQATFVPAYVVTNEYVSGSNHYYPGAPVTENNANTSRAYVCTNTIALSSTEYIYVNDLMTEAEKEKLKTDYPSLADDIDEMIVPAYYCTEAGLYGGNVYKQGENYRALNVWSMMTEAERANFTFNYDALDLLIDPVYGKNSAGVREKEGHKYQYDGDYESADQVKDPTTGNKATYSLATPIDYTATYHGTSDEDTTPLTYTDASNVEQSVAVNQELTREQYEALPNEQRHYTPITVKVGATVQDTYTIYVVKEDFVHIETPYAVGTTIDSDIYSKLSSNEQANVATLTFSKSELNHTTTDETTTYNTTTFYYCREGYEVNEKGMGHDVKSVKGEGSGTTYTSSTEGGVPKGAVIAEVDYSALANKQKNFTIHGKSPMETSTLFVSRNSDINDLSTEKIITVIYKYDYEESDVSGLHVTPVSERHIVNIHIKFESGVPIVDDIKAPGIVLPGTSITMRVPTVTPGAYEVTGGGWELFENDTYAESHTNGVPYKPSADSLYWYQDGYLLAYYAKTYLGKTYSNAVPVSVANYHDLKKVMDDKNFHLHVDYDRTKLKRDSKIYINDYSSSSQNGLDLLKDLFDLSLLTKDDVNTDSKTGLITTIKDGSADSPFKGHALLNTETKVIEGKDVMVGVKGCENLQFYLRTDIHHTDTPSTDDWTPIGTDDQCFEGTLHGDGHTISGLDHSLFYNLCGDVYNLGVTGSFNSAGVVDKGTGYVESAWVKSTNKSPLGSKPYAVFGNPTDTKGYQVVNSYFWKGNKGLYTISGDDPEVDDEEETITSGGVRGTARAMTTEEFYNGTVAYDLNNFYLYKRYSDKEVTEGEEKAKYRYYTIDDDNKLVLQPYKYYDVHADKCSSGVIDESGYANTYVEDRFWDGDFRYASGTIPGRADERQYIDPTDEKHEIYHFPIWPDDYLFFGQMLTYGYSDTQAHQALPSAIMKTNGRLPDNENNNRVYRAPAYFGNSTMGVAHFNPNVYLAQSKKGDSNTKAYPDMTAIDFAGHNAPVFSGSSTYDLGAVTASSGSAAGTTQFYPPLLDDDGLLSINNIDETKNLLVYAPAVDDNAKTHGVLTSYFKDPVYTEYYDNTDGYRLVRKSDKSIYGHLVQSDLTATNDHLLVDKEDFNCPIAYDFVKGSMTTPATRMWYQRTPDEKEYVAPVWTGTPAVRSTTGWQGVSIPFTAELVTTNQKGEITHFYETIDELQNSKNGTRTKIGHEYWLREFKAGGSLSGDVYEAKMTYPDATSGSKNYTNTFLWDYYYKNESKHNQKDGNDDTYQTYYNSPHTYTGYPLLTGAKPYIIGLPGKTYYEFDLSGSFEAENTKVKVDKLEQQTITFASDEGIRVKVSDTELATTGCVTLEGYTFKANYMSKELTAYPETPEAGKTYNTSYVLNTEGRSYNLVTATTKNAVPFRPYFTGSITVPSESRPVTRSIVFANGDVEIGSPKDDHSGRESDSPGTLITTTKRHMIIVSSTMKVNATVRIVNAAGITLNTFDIKPGETIETRVNSSGVYMVQSADGLYIKKISVS